MECVGSVLARSSMTHEWVYMEEKGPTLLLKGDSKTHVGRVYVSFKGGFIPISELIKKWIKRVGKG